MAIEAGIYQDTNDTEAGNLNEDSVAYVQDTLQARNMTTISEETITGDRKRPLVLEQVDVGETWKLVHTFTYIKSTADKEAAQWDKVVVTLVEIT